MDRHAIRFIQLLRKDEAMKNERHFCQVKLSKIIDGVSQKPDRSPFSISFSASATKLSYRP